MQQQIEGQYCVVYLPARNCICRAYCKKAPMSNGRVWVFLIDYLTERLVPVREIRKVRLLFLHSNNPYYVYLLRLDHFFPFYSFINTVALKRTVDVTYSGLLDSSSRVFDDD